jgi:uncharacterized protein (DUF736 family)
MMRKRILNQESQDVSLADRNWLALEQLAQVEVTSEDSAHPVEAALMPGAGQAWRASQSGEQTIRLLFDEPQRLKRIHLVFDEHKQERTQEMVLLWSRDNGQSYQEVVRQQYNFSPPTTTREVEDYNVNLEGVTILELRIVPDINRGSAVASLTQLRLA